MGPSAALNSGTLVLVFRFYCDRSGPNPYFRDIKREVVPAAVNS